MKKIAILSAFLLLMGLGTSAQAGITLIDGYAAFLNYCANPSVENFEDQTLIAGLSITEIGGAGTIANGVYENIVAANPLRYQVFVYSPTMNAFGAWLDLSVGGQGTSIDMYINDTNTFVRNVPNTALGQFYGFYSDAAFTGVRFEDGGGSGAQETYFNVDLALCPNPVPLPPSVLLLGTGILGLVGLGWRRARKES